MRRSSIGRAATIIFAFTFLSLVFTGSVSLGQAPSQEGCMNQWLFNGIWRVQVTKVEPLMDGAQQVGWQVTEIWRNGASKVISPADSVLQDQELELGTGSILASASTTGTLSMQSVAFHDFPVAGEFTYVQQFRAPNIDPANKPKALDITFNGAKLATFTSKPQFTTAKYNFRFKLDCQATGAAAQAQGGSTQIAAKDGCLNEWMSNGIWRMRATAIAPDLGNDNSGPQGGWMISQEWTNLTGKPLAPSDTLSSDQQLVFASGSSVASSNTAVTSMNMQQLAFRTFPPNGSFSYQQRFRPSTFDASDKPVKLLVVFDAATQNKRENKPHYSLPANFRISFDCNK